MKINTNPVGNYTIQQVQTKSVNAAKTKKIIPKSENKLGNQADTGLSAEEKNFFVKQYPLNKNEIMDYHYYRKNGKMAGVKVGSIIDKRG